MPLKTSKLAALVRRLRGSKTLEEFAKLTGVNMATLSRCEKKNAGMSLRNLHRIAQAHSKTVDELFRGTFEVEWNPLVLERPTPYGGLDRADQKIVDDLIDLLREADDETRRDAKRQLVLLRRASKAPKKRASGNG